MRTPQCLHNRHPSRSKVDGVCKIANRAVLERCIVTVMQLRLQEGGHPSLHPTPCTKPSREPAEGKQQVFAPLFTPAPQEMVLTPDNRAVQLPCFLTLSCPKSPPCSCHCSLWVVGDGSSHLPVAQTG